MYNVHHNYIFHNFRTLSRRYLLSLLNNTFVEFDAFMSNIVRRILLTYIVSNIRQSSSCFSGFLAHNVAHVALSVKFFEQLTSTISGYHTIGCLSGMFWASLTIWYSSRFVIFVVAFSNQHQFNSHCWVSTSLFFSSSSSFVFNALVFDACVAQMLLDYCWKNSIILKVELQFFPLFSFSSNDFFSG